MSVSLVGARVGDVAVGTHTMNKDLKIRFHSDVMPHSKSISYFLESYDEHLGWSKLVTIARRYQHDKFDGMSDREIKDWILEYQHPGGGKGGKFLPDETLIEVLSSGPKTKLPSSIVDGIMSVQEIQEALPKPTLSLFYHIWDGQSEDHILKEGDIKPDTLVIYNGAVTTFDGISEDMYDQEDLTFYKFNLGKESLTIAVPQGPDDLLTPELIDKIGLDMSIYDKVVEGTKYFTPGGYKSLLQKLVRFKPEQVGVVTSDGWTYLDPIQVGMSVFLILYLSPGSFVPDMQRYVSGKESALKRLAVTIVEDSYIEDYTIISDLLANALISQFVKGYRITEHDAVRYISALKDALTTTRCFVYDTSASARIGVPTLDTDEHSLSAYLLSTIGSFKCDIAMMATTDGTYMDNSYGPNRELTMDISKSIDQHWRPNMVYLFPEWFIDLHCNDASKKTPFSGLMDAIWQHSSSYNPRKMAWRNANGSFQAYKVVSEVQRNYHLYNLGLFDKIASQSFTSNTIGLTVMSDTLSRVYTLPKSYISSKIGVMYTSFGAMMCVDASNIDRISVSKKPSRTNSESHLSPIQEDEAIKIAKTRLAKGVNGVKCVWDDDGLAYYTINGQPLDVWLTRDVSPNIAKLDMKVINRLSVPLPNTNISTIMNVDSLDFSMFKQEELNRANYHVSISDEQLSLPTVSRDGGSASYNDAGAYKVINMLACYYPYILTQTTIGTFDVHDRYLLIKLMKELTHVPLISDEDLEYGDPITDSKQREPYAHQVETLEELKKKKNNFIWIPVGMGKTYIVCSYISYLHSIGQLPSHVIYTMPKSAFKTVSDEMEWWGLTPNHIVPLAKKTWSLFPFSLDHVVNIIEHDHLRLIDSELETVIDTSLFIVDEVHKTLSETQRSNSALTLASLSDNFLVLTGTPTINTDMSLLINWLKMTVDFPINKNNFWIAISSMISKQVNTGVLVHQEDIFTPLEPTQEKQFKELVGRNIGGTNDKVSHADITKAFDIAYERVDRAIVEFTLENLDNGVFIVTRNKDHQQVIKDMLLATGEVYESDIGLVTKDNVYNLISPDDPGPVIVITTTRMSEGYTLTKLGTMITSVYFSNLATRQQLEGRINRISQVRNSVNIFTLYTRLLDLVMVNYKYVSSVANAIKLLSE